MARIDFDGKRNKYAVYTGPVSDDKLLNPLNNISSMKWHSDLPYVGITETRTVSVDLDARTWPTFESKTLFAHGKGFAPMVLGYALIGSVKVPIQGDWLVAMGSSVVGYNIVSDATNVYIKFTYLSTPSWRTTNVTLVLHLCNVGLTAGGAPVQATKATKAEIGTTRFKAGYFDTNNKHIAASSTGDLAFYKDASLSVQITYDGLYTHVGFAQNVLGHVVRYISTTDMPTIPQPVITRTKVA